MSKRKAGVNDIIYELDNDDIEISSEDEAAKDAKIFRLDSKSPVSDTKNYSNDDSYSQESIDIGSHKENTLPLLEKNGGKISPISTFSDDKTVYNNGVQVQHLENNVDIDKKNSMDGTKTMIFNEDIVIDSPASNSDLGAIGCVNRTPLVTVKFNDIKLAKVYKEKVKAFMLRLIKLHCEDSSDTETDLELDIWPEDLIEDDFINPVEKEPEDNLFFIDTAPCDAPVEVPTYSQLSTVISNVPDREPTPPMAMRRGPTCFNCDGSHRLQDCLAPKNKARIAENRKNMTTRVGRYHVEDEQKYGHLIPGRISGKLRHALGLKRHELPLHIYRMRLLGYPPGWLEEARISHSGITMFDSSGTAIQDPEEEEGELCDLGSKDKFDIKKILDFPGFNVKASSRYKEEAHLYNLPPMSDQDSKIVMLAKLAPNAMMAYKRKKLTFFPSASLNTNQEGQAEMELDSGDETAVFPWNPPLPDEAPPEAPRPPPPPPPPPPHSPESDVITVDDKTDPDNSDVVIVEQNVSLVTVDDSLSDDKLDVNDKYHISSPTLNDLENKKQKLLDALEGDISPIGSDVEMEDYSEYDDSQETEQQSDNKVVVVSSESDKGTANVSKSDDVTRTSLENASVSASDDVMRTSSEKASVAASDDVTRTSSDKASVAASDDVTRTSSDKASLFASDDVTRTSSDKASLFASASDDVTRTSSDKSSLFASASDDVTRTSTDKASLSASASDDVTRTSSDKASVSVSDADSESTMELRTGHVKTTMYGTPVMNVASPYVKLPTDDKFAKDICDVINFENLPNSTGKYKQISKLLKKVKSEVDRIQES